MKSKLTVKDLAQQASDAAAGYTGAARDAAMEVSTICTRRAHYLFQPV